jgi:putative phage-type endonuclease
MKIVKCEQGSAEWFLARTGVITASRFKDACSVLKSGEPSAAAKDYLLELAYERISGDMAPKFVNAAMSRGSELEPDAADAYTVETGEMLEEIGFVLHDELPIGCSPDRLVGDDGLIEIKCPFDVKRVLQFWASKDASEYIHQIQGQMWLTGRRWCDLCVYDPRLTGADMALCIHRIERDEDFIKSMESQLRDFVSKLNQTIETIRSNKK